MFFIRTDGQADTRSTQNYSSEPHKILISIFFFFYQNIEEEIICKKNIMIGSLLKKGYKDLPKKSPKKNFSKINKKFIEQKKTIYFLKKACQKYSSKKVLKRKKNINQKKASFN